MRPTGRLVSLGALTAVLVVQPIPALAQQGSLQVSTAVQTLHGDPQRFAGQHPLEPDIGISWLQPGSRVGMFQIEIRGARRGDTLHTGRIYGALRDAKYGGIAWTIEAGDAYFSPGVSDYRFSNLFTPAVTFNGAAVTGRTEHDVVTVVAGRSTAWRSIFGNDPQGLGQSLAIARITHRPTNRLELSARGSRVRTSSLREFSYTIDASDQVGAGATVGLTSSLRLVADASLVSYRRAGVASRERDGSYLGGLSWLHSRGWMQVNASRFSAGDFPALNNPLHDREEVFAAAEQDLTSRTRVSGGWEKFRSNLNPERSASSTTPVPESAGTRGFGAFRVQLTSRSAVTVRGERGDRESRPVGPGFYSDSDTGMWAAEWQAAVGGTTAFVRYSGRENVEHLNETGSYDQRDALAQIYANVTRRSQIFGTAMLTHTAAGPGGNNYWQTGGGAQVRMGNRDLWLRGESTIARNMDLLTRVYVPRESLIIGVNGQMSRSTTLAFNVNLDRTPVFASAGSPWVTRSMVRVTRNLPTGSVYMANTIASSAAESGRGTGTVSGLVFADWNANGVQDAGESALEGIPMRLGNGHSATGHDGQFAFVNVPVGTRSIGLDTGALPIDFDPPAVSQIQVELSRGDAKRVAFGLVPLGLIEGRVIRDVNGNGKADPNEEPIDGAVVVLDSGARSEQARKGQYRFEAVRSGTHLVKLLIESLPEGAIIAGDAEVPAALSQGALSADVSFLVSVEKRPEIRRVFPSRGGTTSSSAAPPRSSTGRGASAPAATAAAEPSRDTRAETFAIQIAALNDAVRARSLVGHLKASGLPAYLVEPPATDPDAPYRVRVGPYPSREEAQKVAAKLEAQRGERLWVVRENR